MSYLYDLKMDEKIEPIYIPAHNRGTVDKPIEVLECCVVSVVDPVLNCKYKLVGLGEMATLFAFELSPCRHINRVDVVRRDYMGRVFDKDGQPVYENGEHKRILKTALQVRNIELRPNDVLVDTPADWDGYHLDLIRYHIDGGVFKPDVMKHRFAFATVTWPNNYLPPNLKHTTTQQRMKGGDVMSEEESTIGLFCEGCEEDCAECEKSGALLMFVDDPEDGAWPDDFFE